MPCATPSASWPSSAPAAFPPHLAVQGYLLLIATVNGFTIDETGVDDSADSSQGALLRGSEGEDADEIVPGVNCPGWLGACGLARDLVERLPR